MSFAGRKSFDAFVVGTGKHGEGGQQVHRPPFPFCTVYSYSSDPSCVIFWLFIRLLPGFKVLPRFSLVFLCAPLAPIAFVSALALCNFDVRLAKLEACFTAGFRPKNRGAASRKAWGVWEVHMLRSENAGAVPGRRGRPPLTR